MGRNGLQRLIAIIADQSDDRLPAMARASLIVLGSQLQLVNEQVLENDRRVKATARSTELGRRLMEVPRVGQLLASAMVASVPDPTAFRFGRDLAAWIGLVPRQNASGGTEKLGGIARAAVATAPSAFRISRISGLSGASSGNGTSLSRPTNGPPVLVLIWLSHGAAT